MLADVAKRLTPDARVTVLTGAGVSAASGIPTFRGPDGLWKQFRPEQLATAGAFARDPRLVWEWYDWRRQRIAACGPNRAHEVFAQVWAVMRDIERWSEWTPSVRSIQRLNGGPLAVGSRARIRQPKLPPADWQVTVLEEGRGFTWVARSPGVSVTARHWIDVLGDGSRATLSIQYGGVLGPLVGWLTRGLNRRYIALEAAGLKRRSEEAPAARPGTRP